LNIDMGLVSLAGIVFARSTNNILDSQ